MNSIKKNYIYNVIYEILLIIIPLITSPYISRVLGAEQVGIYSYCYSVVSYFMLFARLGIVNHGSRSIASALNENERNKIFSNTLAVQGCLSVMVIISYIMYLNFFNVQNYVISALMITYLIATAFDINWFFFGIEQFKVTVSRNIIIKIMSTILLFVFVKERVDLWKYVLILGFAQLGGQLVVWPYLRDKVKLVKPNIENMLEQLLPMFILFIPQIAVSLYKMMDKIMLGWFCVKEQLGYYEYATTIVNLPLGFITSLGTVMLPRISAMMKTGENKKTLVYTRYSIIFAISLSTAFTFGISAIAPTFVPFYFGQEFEPAVKLLIGLSSTLIFISWANVIRTQFLIPAKKDKEYIISLFTGAFVNVIINFIFIPRFLAWGAVIGTIVAEVTVCVMQTLMSKKYIPIWKYIKECFPFILIGSVMFIVVRFVSYIHFPIIISLILQIVVGVIVYLGLVSIYAFIVWKVSIITFIRSIKDKK